MQLVAKDLAPRLVGFHPKLFVKGFPEENLQKMMPGCSNGSGLLPIHILSMLCLEMVCQKFAAHAKTLWFDITVVLFSDQKLVLVANA